MLEQITVTTTPRVLAFLINTVTLGRVNKAKAKAIDGASYMCDLAEGQIHYSNDLNRTNNRRMREVSASIESDLPAPTLPIQSSMDVTRTFVTTYRGVTITATARRQKRFY